jgi:hypothetical protein
MSTQPPVERGDVADYCSKLRWLDTFWEFRRAIPLQSLVLVAARNFLSSANLAKVPHEGGICKQPQRYWETSKKGFYDFIQM